MGFLQRLVNTARIRSPYIFHFNSGSCNGCDIEIIAALMPRIDVERFGAKLVGSPRHADVMLVTGPVTRKLAPRLKRIYEQMPEPKYVVAVGTCACSGGNFRGGYGNLGGVDQAIPVTAYIPGCAVKPAAIIYGLYRLLEELADEFDLIKPIPLKKAVWDKSQPKDEVVPHELEQKIKKEAAKS